MCTSASYDAVAIRAASGLTKLMEVCAFVALADAYMGSISRAFVAAFYCSPDEHRYGGKTSAVSLWLLHWVTVQDLLGPKQLLATFWAQSHLKSYAHSRSTLQLHLVQARLASRERHCLQEVCIRPLFADHCGGTGELCVGRHPCMVSVDFEPSGICNHDSDQSRIGVLTTRHPLPGHFRVVKDIHHLKELPSLEQQATGTTFEKCYRGTAVLPRRPHKDLPNFLARMLAACLLEAAAYTLTFWAPPRKGSFAALMALRNKQHWALPEQPPLTSRESGNPLQAPLQRTPL